MIRLIVIGTSAGGITALQNLFKALPAFFSIPIVVTQHISPGAMVDPQLVFGHAFKGLLLEAVDKVIPEKGHVYFAPPDYHLLIEKDGSLSLSQDDPVHFARPSIDVLFESAAVALGKDVCGVLLTGANQDGAAGLKAIADQGGITMVQDPDTAEYPMMPRAALQLFNPKYTMNLQSLSEKLISLAEGLT